jgi:Calreticulin family
VDTKRIPDPDATKPDDWDEDEPYEILDEEAQKPEGWLDDEPLSIPDPGVYFLACGLSFTYASIQMPRSPRNGMTRKTATISHLLFQTPSVPKLLVAASGSGNKFRLLLILPILILLFLFQPIQAEPAL